MKFMNVLFILLETIKENPEIHCLFKEIPDQGGNPIITVSINKYDEPSIFKLTKTTSKLLNLIPLYQVALMRNDIEKIAFDKTDTSSIFGEKLYYIRIFFWNGVMKRYSTDDIQITKDDYMCNPDRYTNLMTSTDYPLNVFNGYKGNARKVFNQVKNNIDEYMDEKFTRRQLVDEINKLKENFVYNRYIDMGIDIVNCMIKTLYRSNNKEGDSSIKLVGGYIDALIDIYFIMVHTENINGIHFRRENGYCGYYFYLKENEPLKIDTSVPNKIKKIAENRKDITVVKFDRNLEAFTVFGSGGEHMVFMSEIEDIIRERGMRNLECL